MVLCVTSWMATMSIDIDTARRAEENTKTPLRPRYTEKMENRT